MKKVIVLLLVTLLVVSSLFTGCGQQPPANETASSDETGSDEEFSIAVDLQSLDIPYVVELKGYIEDAFKDYPNVKYTIMDARQNQATQLQQVETFIAQGYDAIILSPVEEEGAMAAVEAANAAGIPVITLIQQVTDMSKVTAHVGQDHKEAAVLACQYGFELIGGKGNVALVQGPLGQTAVNRRTEGFEEVLAKYPDAKLIAKDTGNWARDQALTLAENWLQSGMDINLFFCQNDNMALGVVQAIEEAGLKDKIHVVSIDGDADALEAVKNGRLDATIVIPAKDMAYGSVDSALKILKGEEYEKLKYVDMIVCNKDNVDQYIK